MATCTWTNFLNRYARPILGDVNGSIEEAYLNSLTGLVITDLYSKGVYDIGPLPSQLADNTAYTVINALVDDGYPLLVSGIKYFLYSDPTTKIQPAGGIETIKEKEMVSSLKNNYDELLKAYIQINYYGVDKQTYWLDSLSSSLGEVKSKIDKVNLGINEYNTSAGAFGVTYVSDYFVEYQPSLETKTDKPVEAIDFGFAGSISNQTLTGIEVDVAAYRMFGLTFISPAVCTVQLQSKQPDGTWINAVPSVTGNVFLKKYALISVNTIRLVVSTVATTNFEIRGTLTL